MMNPRSNHEAEWPTLRPTTLSDGVYSVLRERIHEGMLTPGSAIREAEVGRALGVSRTPVREALGRLATEGLLERLPHRGFRVAAPPPEDLRELYPLVSALDNLAGRLAIPQLSDTDLDHLEAINRELAGALVRDDVRASVNADHAFHGLIAERSGNDMLRGMLADLRHRLLQGEVVRFDHVADPDTASCRMHRRFLDAARRGDAESAARAIEADRFWTERALDGEADGQTHLRRVAI